MSLGKKILAGSLVAVVLLVLAAVGGVFFIVPNVAQSMVREKLDRAEEKFGLQVTTGAIETKGLAGVEITDLTVTDPESGRTLVKVATVGASLDTPSLLTGDRVIDKVWTRDVNVTITREDDGQFDLVRVIQRARGGGEDDPAEPTEEGTSGGGLLRLFGGTLPELDVANVQIVFDKTDNAPVFPVTKLTIPTGEIEHDDGIALSTVVSVESIESESWTVPTSVEAAVRFSDELVLQAMNVKFDKPVELGGIEPYPFLRAGFTGMEMTDDGAVAVTDFHLGFQSNKGKDSFLTIKRVGASLAEFALDPRKMKLGAVVVDSPSLTISYDAIGAGHLTDLDHAIRAPRARDVAARARSFAVDLAERKKKKTEPTDEEEDIVAEEEAEPPAKDEEPSRWMKLVDYVPERVTIANANVVVTDSRPLPVVRRARVLRMQDGNFEITHAASEGRFGVEAGFKAIADEQDRGAVKSMVTLHYLTKTLDADIEVDALDLSWLGQILGPRVAEHIRGGTLRSKVGVKPAKGRAVTIDGLVSVDDLVLFHSLLAEDPIADFSASYSFVANYDPTATIPDPQLIKKGLFKEGKAPPKGDSMYQGALVFQKGQATVGDVKMGFTPAVYGTGALPSRLPARLDFRVDLPPTSTQALFDAVPVAIQGPLQGTKLAGTLGWTLRTEIPLHRAGDMEWESVPTLEEFEIIEMPRDMHPEKLMKGFQLTITDTLTDEKGEEYEWSRTVRIPAAQPVSAKYLVENGGIEIETLDARRREREWPPMPDPRRSFLPKVTLESPEYWYTTHAENQTAKKPWTSYDRIERTERKPYGDYVFVPLQHIAPWVVRTVTTTEDGGFFRHPGFLFDSLKESVEDNIEAGRMRRGGSTISMQLVKNGFLDRKKLIARKIREAFLVFLMESVVDVPKSRILEVYLNIIEFGPGIYGIHDASVHYFGKRPDELEINEVAWLFSILPNPKKYHFFWDRGEISDRWFAKMKRYIDAMYRRDKITEEQRDAANAEPPLFYKPDVENDEPVLKAKTFGGVPLLWDGPLADPAPRQNSPTPVKPLNPKTPPTPAPTKKKKGWFGR